MNFRVYNKLEQSYGRRIHIDDNRIDYEFGGGVTNLEYALTNQQYKVEIMSDIKDINNLNLFEGDVVECDIDGMGKTQCYVDFGGYGFNLVLDDPDGLPLQFDWKDASDIRITGIKNPIQVI